MVLAVLSGIELMLVVGIVVLVFGAGWMPKMARKAGQTKVQLDEAKAELDKAKAGFTAPIKGATDLVAKVDRTINVKPKDIVKRMVAPTAATGPAVVVPTGGSPGVSEVTENSFDDAVAEAYDAEEDPSDSGPAAS